MSDLRYGQSRGQVSSTSRPAASPHERDEQARQRPVRSGLERVGQDASVRCIEPVAQKGAGRGRRRRGSPARRSFRVGCSPGRTRAWARAGGSPTVLRGSSPADEVGLLGTSWMSPPRSGRTPRAIRWRIAGPSEQTEDVSPLVSPTIAGSCADGVPAEADRPAPTSSPNATSDAAARTALTRVLLANTAGRPSWRTGTPHRRPSWPVGSRGRSPRAPWPAPASWRAPTRRHRRA